MAAMGDDDMSGPLSPVRQGAQSPWGEEVTVGVQPLSEPRGLGAGEEDLGRWARFVEGCFSFKAPPPSRHHFLRHYHQDPHNKQLQQPSGGGDGEGWVRVIEDANGHIVATARVCLRPLDVSPAAAKAAPAAAAVAPTGVPTQAGGSAVWAAGIAEVCVAKGMQGQGLAKKVVDDALRHVAAVRPDVRLSLLHCAPALTRVYGAMGYRSLPVAWRRLPIPRTPAAASACADALRQGRYAAAPLTTADLDEVAELHAAAPGAMRGIVKRPAPHWEYWWQGELSALPRAPAPLWGVRDARGRLVLYAVFRYPPFSSPAGASAATTGGVGTTTSTTTTTAMGSSAPLSPAEELTVLDLACAADEVGRARLFLQALALAAVRASPETAAIRTMRCPAAALGGGGEADDVVEGEEQLQAAAAESDVGWMFRPVGDEGDDGEAWRALQARAKEGQGIVVWPIDHF